MLRTTKHPKLSPTHPKWPNQKRYLRAHLNYVMCERASRFYGIAGYFRTFSLNQIKAHPHGRSRVLWENPNTEGHTHTHICIQ